MTTEFEAQPTGIAALLPKFFDANEVLGLIAFGDPKGFEKAAVPGARVPKAWRRIRLFSPSDNQWIAYYPFQAAPERPFEEIPLAASILQLIARTSSWRSDHKAAREAPLTAQRRALVRQLYREYRATINSDGTIESLLAEMRAFLDTPQSRLPGQMARATEILRHALANEYLTVEGIKGNWPKLNRRANHAVVDHSFFAHADTEITLTGWAMRTDDLALRAQQWGELRFNREEVLRLWPRAVTPAPEITSDALAAVSPAGSQQKRNRPGPPPVKRTETLGRMLSDYANDPDRLAGEKQELLVNVYGVSVDVARKARDAALEQLRLNSDKTPITDK